MTDYVIVTGGARNIGAAIAERLTRAGLAALVLDRDEPAHGSFYDFVRIDLVDVAALQRALASLNARCPATRLVNNVGVVSPARLEDADPNSLDHVMALNVRAALVCAQAVLPIMKGAGFGRIVNIASRAMQGRETRSVYAASKAALHGLTRVWALELGRHGVTANTVAPGPIRTPLFDAVNPLGSSLRESLLSDIPLRRMGEPSDVAEAVSYFLSEEAGFVTGQLLYVCGGLSVGRTSE